MENVAARLQALTAQKEDSSQKIRDKGPRPTIPQVNGPGTALIFDVHQYIDRLRAELATLRARAPTAEAAEEAEEQVPSTETVAGLLLRATELLKAGAGEPAVAQDVARQMVMCLDVLHCKLTQPADQMKFAHVASETILSTAVAASMRLLPTHLQTALRKKHGGDVPFMAVWHAANLHVVCGMAENLGVPKSTLRVVHRPEADDHDLVDLTHDLLHISQAVTVVTERTMQATHANDRLNGVLRTQRQDVKMLEEALRAQQLKHSANTEVLRQQMHNTCDALQKDMKKAQISRAALEKALSVADAQATKADAQATRAAAELEEERARAASAQQAVAQLEEKVRVAEASVQTHQKARDAAKEAAVKDMLKRMRQFLDKSTVDTSVS